MSAAPVIYRLAPGPDALVRKSLDAATRVVKSVLTYPGRDYAGDTVAPAGGDWSTYPKNPQVNWEHGIPVGRGAVALATVPGNAGRVTVPTGATTFFQSERDTKGIELVSRDGRGRVAERFTPAACVAAAADAWRLVADDIATGVSLEFTPRGPDSYRVTARKSLIEPRNGIDFYRWTGLGWAHCLRPVNPNARTLLPDDGRMDKAIRLAETGRWAKDGPPVSPPIRKSLETLLTLPRRPVVRSGFVEKAMPDALYADAEATPAVADAAPPDDPALAGDDTGGDAPPTAQAAYDAAQGVGDLCEMIDAALQKAEHVKGRAKLRKLCDDLRGYADDFTAIAEMVEADLGDKDDAAPADSDSDDPPADDGDDKDDDTDLYESKAIFEAGVLVTKSGYKPRRFRAADVRPAAETPAAPVVSLKGVLRESRAARRALR